jgi:hypothetical protein
MDADMLKEHFLDFLVIYCLIKSLKALLNIKEQFNKENPYLIFSLLGKDYLT